MIDTNHDVKIDSGACMNDIQSRLDLLYQKVKPPANRKTAEKESERAFKQISAAFRKATPEQRVDIQIAFEDREMLVALFVLYANKLAEAALQAARKDKRKEAIPALEEACVADAIIDGRTNHDDLQRLHKHLMAAAEELRFDVEGFLRPFETPVRVYIQRAYEMHQDRNRIQAMRVLGRALQLDHTLYKNERIIEFAASLTGQSPKTAIMTLEDAYLRNRFIAEFEQARR